MRLFAVAILALSLALPVGAQDEVAYPDYTVSSDLSALPEAVRETREALVAAALTGDIEALRPIIEAQQYPPTVSYGGPDDAVDYLKSQSADGAGIEPLACWTCSARLTLSSTAAAAIPAMSGPTWPSFRTWRR